MVDSLGESRGAVRAVHVSHASGGFLGADAAGSYEEWRAALSTKYFLGELRAAVRALRNTNDGHRTAKCLVQVSAQPGRAVLVQHDVSVHDNCVERLRNLLEYSEQAGKLALEELTRAVRHHAIHIEYEFASRLGRFPTFRNRASDTSATCRIVVLRIEQRYRAHARRIAVRWAPCHKLGQGSAALNRSTATKGLLHSRAGARAETPPCAPSMNLEETAGAQSPTGTSTCEWRQPAAEAQSRTLAGFRHFNSAR